jgi:hypothetical protein
MPVVAARESGDLTGFNGIFRLILFPSTAARKLIGGIFMAINQKFLLHGPSDKRLFITAAIVFPLLVLTGYFQSYYFRALFADVKPLNGALVHIHGVVMTLWVVYFAVQIALVRSKNVRLHMSAGLAGIALATLAVVTGMAAAYNRHIVQYMGPRGINPHSFFIVPCADMLLFVIYFAGAIYYRRRPIEHKSLMLMTAINFLPPAISRIPVLGNFGMLWSWGVPCLIALACLGWLARKHGEVNKVFAAAVFLLVASYPVRYFLAGTPIWFAFTEWLASLR